MDVDCFFVPGWKVHSEMLDDYDLAPSRARLFLLSYTNSIQLLILGTASLLTGSFFWASFSIKPQGISIWKRDNTWVFCPTDSQIQGVLVLSQRLLIFHW
jgi:hypothetical protein